MQTEHGTEVDLEERVPIGKGAAILGVHAQTLRSYERRKLIAASRTPGGERRFRLGDLLDLRDAAEKAS